MRAFVNGSRDTRTMPPKVTPQAKNTSEEEKTFCEGALKLQQNEKAEVQSILEGFQRCKYCKCLIGGSREMAKSHVPRDSRSPGNPNWAHYKCIQCGEHISSSFASFDYHMEAHQKDGASLS